MHSYNDNVLEIQLTVSMHTRVAAKQRGQEVLDILFSSYRILDGYFCTAWFQRRGHVTGSVSGAWLVVVWSVVLMLYVWIFQSRVAQIKKVVVFMAYFLLSDH